MNRLTLTALFVGILIGAVVSLAVLRLAAHCQPGCWLERVNSPDRVWIDCSCFVECD